MDLHWGGKNSLILICIQPLKIGAHSLDMVLGLINATTRAVCAAYSVNDL